MTLTSKYDSVFSQKIETQPKKIKPRIVELQNKYNAITYNFVDEVKKNTLRQLIYNIQNKQAEKEISYAGVIKYALWKLWNTSWKMGYEDRSDSIVDGKFFLSDTDEIASFAKDEDSNLFDDNFIGQNLESAKRLSGGTNDSFDLREKFAAKKVDTFLNKIKKKNPVLYQEVLKDIRYRETEIAKEISKIQSDNAAVVKQLRKQTKTKTTTPKVDNVNQAKQKKTATKQSKEPYVFQNNKEKQIDTETSTRRSFNSKKKTSDKALTEATTRTQGYLNNLQIQSPSKYKKLLEDNPGIKQQLLQENLLLVNQEIEQKNTYSKLTNQEQLAFLNTQLQNETDPAVIKELEKAKSSTLRKILYLQRGAATVKERRIDEKIFTSSLNIQETGFGKNYLEKRIGFISSRAGDSTNKSMKEAIATYLQKPSLSEKGLLKELKKSLKKDTSVIKLKEIYDEKEQQVKTIKSLFNSKRTTVDLNEKQMDLLGSKTKTINKQQLESLKEDLETEHKLNTAISEYVLTRIGVTEISNAYNLGRLAQFKKDGIEYVQWDTELENQGKGKDAPCKYCESRNGIVVPIDQALNIPFTKDSIKNEKLYIIVAHPFCRCRWIPVQNNKQKQSREGFPLNETGNKVAIPINAFNVTQGILSGYTMMQAYRSYLLSEAEKAKVERRKDNRKLGVVIGTLFIPIAAYAIVKNVKNLFKAKTIINNIVDLSVNNVVNNAIETITGIATEEINEIFTPDIARDLYETIILNRSDELNLSEENTNVVNELINQNLTPQQLKDNLSSLKLNQNQVESILDMAENAKQIRKSQIKKVEDIGKQTIQRVNLPLNIKAQEVQSAILQIPELVRIEEMITSPVAKKKLQLQIKNNQPLTVKQLQNVVTGNDLDKVESLLNNIKGSLAARKISDNLNSLVSGITKNIDLKVLKDPKDLLIVAQKTYRKANTLVQKQQGKIIFDELQEFNKTLKDSQDVLDKVTNYQNEIERLNKEVDEIENLVPGKTPAQRLKNKIKVETFFEKYDETDELIGKLEPTKQLVTDKIAKLDSVQRSSRKAIYNNTEVSGLFNEVSAEINLLLQTNDLDSSMRKEFEKLLKNAQYGSGLGESLVQSIIKLQKNLALLQEVDNNLPDLNSLKLLKTRRNEIIKLINEKRSRGEAAFKQSNGSKQLIKNKLINFSKHYKLANF